MLALVVLAPGLYAILDIDSIRGRRLDWLACARQILAGRPSALQLRAKSAQPRETFDLLKTLAPLAREADVPLVANDRPDLAALTGCWGVHLGQEDLPIEAVRTAFSDLAVGLSTHSLAELRFALAARPDYVAFGPVFATSSKSDAEPTVGIEQLQRAHQLCRACEIPLVAIGGIDQANVSQIAGATDRAAVISALLPASDEEGSITKRTRELHAALLARQP